MCTRCASRELPCKYFQTKRAGRPSTKNTGDQGKKSSGKRSVAAAPLASRKSTISSRESTPKTSLDQGRSPFEQDPPLPQQTPPMTGTFSPSSGSFPEWNTRELDEFFASFEPGPEMSTHSASYDSLMSLGLDAPDMNMDSGDSNAFMSENMFSFDDDAFAAMSTVSGPRPNRYERPSQPCCCIMTALSFLNDSSTPLGRTVTPDGQPLAEIESVISENEGIVASMDNILQCHCSSDAYVLVILSLVVFKILGRYGRAVKAAPGVAKDISQPGSPYRLHRSTSVASSNCAEGEDCSRVAAQLVLGELHHALRLVNELSSRFNQHRIGGKRSLSAGSSSSSSSSSVDMDVVMGDESATPFSPTMLDQLEADLRQRLRSVSLTIIGMLRGA